MGAPMRTPARLTKGQGSSWFCETLSSQVFNGATPSGSTQRPSVAQGAAGQVRERVASQGLAATKFYTESLERPYHPGSADLMSNVLYGKAPADAQVPDRPKHLSQVAFQGAAGHAGSKTDRSAAEPDRHPDLQRAIKIPADARQAASTIDQSELGFSSCAPSSCARAVSVPRARVIPPTPKPHGEAVQELLYASDPAERPPEQPGAATPRRIKAPGVPPSQHTSANGLPVQSYATDPRGAAAARHAPGTPGGGASVAAVDVSDGEYPAGYSRTGPDYLMTAGGDVVAAPGRSGRRDMSFAPSAAATEMPGILGNYDPVPRGSPTRASGGGEGGGGAAATGVSRKRLEPERHERRAQGRAVGSYNPSPRVHDPRERTLGSAPRPASGEFFSMARPHAGGTPGAPGTMAPGPAPPGTAVADAGVHSHRLHELAVTSHNHCFTYARETPEERRQVGVIESRAGTGPRVPTEQRTCGASRRPASADNPQMQPRNPLLGEPRVHLSPPSMRPPVGRAHMAGTHQANTHHLSATLVPEGPRAGDGSKPLRKTGKATGDRSHQTLSHTGTAHQALAGWTIGDKEPGAYGKRHVDAPTHEPQPFGLSHPNGGVAPRSYPDGTSDLPKAASELSSLGVTPAASHELTRQRSVRGASVVGTPAPERTQQPTPSQPPSFRAQESFRSRQDSRSAYEITRMRGSSSNIFSDLAYPSRADE